MLLFDIIWLIEQCVYGTQRATFVCPSSQCLCCFFFFFAFGFAFASSVRVFLSSFSLILYGCSRLSVCVYDISELYSTRSKNKYKLSKYQERQQNICLTFRCVQRRLNCVLWKCYCRFGELNYNTTTYRSFIKRLYYCYQFFAGRKRFGSTTFRSVWNTRNNIISSIKEMCWCCRIVHGCRSGIWSHANNVLYTRCRGDIRLGADLNVDDNWVDISALMECCAIELIRPFYVYQITNSNWIIIVFNNFKTTTPAGGNDWRRLVAVLQQVLFSVHHHCFGLCVQSLMCGCRSGSLFYFGGESTHTPTAPLQSTTTPRSFQSASNKISKRGMK